MGVQLQRAVERVLRPLREPEAEELRGRARAAKVGVRAVRLGEGARELHRRQRHRRLAHERAVGRARALVRGAQPRHARAAAAARGRGAEAEQHVAREEHQPARGALLVRRERPARQLLQRARVERHQRGRRALQQQVGHRRVGAALVEQRDEHRAVEHLRARRGVAAQLAARAERELDDGGGARVAGDDERAPRLAVRQQRAHAVLHRQDAAKAGVQRQRRRGGAHVARADGLQL